ncbi:hypothetical protein R77560_04633 [Ralstonia thomasii]|uniref:KfrA N-terminal DNA-binding domain-containing protein n=1 Tax=Ralstonia thomasii TaxID=3058596 RepID=A0AAD2C299_9RALS|nr:DNA-binding protein [Ralstonia sp. LMG 18095]CAJ0807836.1 hypothetical protein R77560_04633 [Ralstonia sp. LMG 18095]
MEIVRKQPLVTYESVSAAAESLANGGQRPSVRAVLGVLGGGSPNAVLPFLQVWKAARPAIKAADVTIDPRIASILAEQISVAVADATRAAEARAADLESDAEAVAEAGRAAEARAEELAAELARVQSENQQLTGRVSALVEEMDQVKKDAAAAITEARADTHREREAAEQARQALARAELRLESMPALEAQVRDLRSQVETEHRARNAAEKAAAVAEAERNAAVRHAEAAEQAHQEFRKSSAQEVGRLTERTDKAEADRDAARKEAGSAREEAAKLRGQVEAFQAKPSR